jgi:hypothetical protein
MVLPAVAGGAAKVTRGATKATGALRPRGATKSAAEGIFLDYADTTARRRRPSVQERQETPGNGARAGSRQKTASAEQLQQLRQLLAFVLIASGVHFGLWLTLQLPLSVLALIFFGLAGVLDAFLNTWLGWVVGGLASAVASALAYFGLNLGAFHPSHLWLVLHTAVFGFGLLALMTTWLVLQIKGLEPLSGEWGAAKLGLSLLAVIGYAMPVANLVPWVLFYMAALAATLLFASGRSRV